MNIVVLSRLQILPLQLSASKYPPAPPSLLFLQNYPEIQARALLVGISELSNDSIKAELSEARAGQDRTGQADLAGLFSVFISADSLSQLAPRLYFLSGKTIDL